MSGPNGDPHVLGGGTGDDDGDEGGDTFEEEEYAAINSMLDQINSCLDHLEEKNDHLNICLKELLESNRQTRLEFQQQSKQLNMGADVQGSQASCLESDHILSASAAKGTVTGHQFNVKLE